MSDPVETSADTIRSSGSTTNRIVACAVFTILYILTATVGMQVAIVHPGAQATWMLAGISLAACLIFGSWIWPAVFLGAFLSNLASLGPFVSIGIAGGNALEAVLSAYLVNRFAGARASFDRAGDALRFVMLGAGLGTIVAATIGASSLYFGGHLQRPE